MVPEKYSRNEELLRPEVHKWERHLPTWRRASHNTAPIQNWQIEKWKIDWTNGKWHAAKKGPFSKIHHCCM